MHNNTIVNSEDKEKIYILIPVLERKKDTSLNHYILFTKK